MNLCRTCIILSAKVRKQFTERRTGKRRLEWFTEDQASSPSYDLAPPPPPSPVIKLCLSFSFFLCVAGRVYWREGERGWGRSQILRRAESVVLYKSLIFSVLLPTLKQKRIDSHCIYNGDGDGVELTSSTKDKHNRIYYHCCKWLAVMSTPSRHTKKQNIIIETRKCRRRCSIFTDVLLVQCTCTECLHFFSIGYPVYKCTNRNSSLYINILFVLWLFEHSFILAFTAWRTTSE